MIIPAEHWFSSINLRLIYGFGNLNLKFYLQAIHMGATCHQYQDRMKDESMLNDESKRTKDFLEEMVQKGEAIACPTCKVREKCVFSLFTCAGPTLTAFLLFLISIFNE